MYKKRETIRAQGRTFGKLRMIEQKEPEKQNQGNKINSRYIISKIVNKIRGFIWQSVLIICHYITNNPRI